MDTLDTMKVIEKNLNDMKAAGLISGYELEFMDTVDDTTEWKLFTW